MTVEGEPMTVCRRIVLRSRPQGAVRESDFAIESVAVAAPAPRQVLIEVDCISVDAFPAALVKLFSGGHTGKLLVEP
jgi:NADPH-dependent curcumin reductase CurA